MTNSRTIAFSAIAISTGFLMIVPLSAQSSAVGNIQITVLNEQGQAISGAAVQYTRWPKTIILGKRESPSPGETMVHATTSTNGNGQIAAAGLPVGTYALCASVAGAAYLDPCVWQQPVQISVVSSNITARTVVLKKKVFLNVRVDDSGGLLPSDTGQIWGHPKLLIGVVYGGGAYQALPNATNNGATHSYQLAVPTGAAFSLRIFSTDVALKDASGAAVDTSGTGIPFHTVAGQDVTYSFTVSGATRE